MSETADYIKARIARLEKERANALARAAEFSRKAEEMLKTAEELTIVLRHVQDWGSDLESGGQMVSRMVIESNGHGVVQGGVRAAVGECLKHLHQFNAVQLRDAVQHILPEAKDGTIRAELSYRKTRGDVRLIDKDFYESNLYSNITDWSPDVDQQV